VVCIDRRSRPSASGLDYEAVYWRSRPPPFSSLSRISGRAQHSVPARSPLAPIRRRARRRWLPALLLRPVGTARNPTKPGSVVGQETPRRRVSWARARAGVRHRPPARPHLDAHRRRPRARGWLRPPHRGYSEHPARPVRLTRRRPRERHRRTAGQRVVPRRTSPPVRAPARRRTSRVRVIRVPVRHPQ